MISLKYRPLEILEITSYYGIREFGGLEFHPGIDYKMPVGSNIYSVDDGKVVVAKNDAEGYGLYVVIEHSNYCTLYAHLKALEIIVGQSIRAGEIIGRVGMTGMTTGPHLHFEIRDCLYDAMFWLKSLLKGRHVMCINPEDLVKEAKQVPNISYKKYSDNLHELKGEVKDFSVKVVNKSNKSITEPFCTNGTYFWHTDTGEKYSTSILYSDNKVYQVAANHLPCPQSCIIIYKNNNVEMNYIYNLSDIDLKNVRLVIGGVGLRNTFNQAFKYNPALEGFKDVYADVLRRSNKTVIGYNKSLNKMYLLALKDITMQQLLSIISDNSTGEAYDIALMVDGGGSTFMNNADDMIVNGDGRTIHNIIGFNL